ncbi:MAG: murein DD-endopeptidase MepM/ murein hydrolase activator NlpD [Cellvibrionaceae bacterium]|jgi:murein DD-endopeptidase MepM/ murein hydrolase activator NlpD
MKNTALCITLVFLLAFTFTLQALEISGTWIQGGMLIGETSPEHKIRFLDRKVKVNAGGQFVIGLGRDIASEVQLIEIFPNSVERTHSFSVRQRRYREQRIEGVPKKTVHVPESQLSRIRQDSGLVKRARQIDSNRQDFFEDFAWPARGVISGVYGSRRYYNGEPRRPHYGVDIAAPQGTKVFAPAAGRVTLVHRDMFFSGGTLIIDHGHGISSTFIHLHKILVEEGREVQQKTIIAEIGATGRATGPHLDWRMNWFNQRLDPQLLMDSLPAKLSE